MRPSISEREYVMTLDVQMLARSPGVRRERIQARCRRAFQRQHCRRRPLRPALQPVCPYLPRPQPVLPDPMCVSFNLDRVRSEIQATSTCRTMVALQSTAKCCTDARSFTSLVKNRCRVDRSFHLSEDAIRAFDRSLVFSICSRGRFQSRWKMKYGGIYRFGPLPTA